MLRTPVPQGLIGALGFMGEPFLQNATPCQKVLEPAPPPATPEEEIRLVIQGRQFPGDEAQGEALAQVEIVPVGDLEIPVRVVEIVGGVVVQGVILGDAVDRAGRQVDKGLALRGEGTELTCLPSTGLRFETRLAIVGGAERPTTTYLVTTSVSGPRIVTHRCPAALILFARVDCLGLDMFHRLKIQAQREPCGTDSE